jgi:hypothetical protein
MTNRPQILRSSTPGQVPAAGTRLAGELWTTFPDLQLGVIDATKTAQKLIAVRFFSTTANYAIGDFVVQAGVLYAAKGAITAGAFNSTQWTKVAASTDAGGPYLAIGGGTLTGALLLAADPGAALGAATKQYVDGKVTAAPFLPLAGGTLIGPVVLSGPPTIPLHAATKAYVDSGAFVPIAGGTMTGDLILNRNPVVALGAVTKQYVDVLPVAMNDNRIINGNFAINQRGYVSGTALPASPTVANGYGHDRWKAGANGCTYTFTATLADTTITITANTLTQIIEAGMIEGGVFTLSWTGTAQARVYQGTPTGSYAASPIVTASLTAGTNTTVEFNTGSVGRVKFENGAVATPFNRQSLAKSMADCQRHYQKLGGSVAADLYVSGYVSAAGSGVTCTLGIPQMRAAPTTTRVGAWTLANVTTITFFTGLNSMSFSLTSTAAGLLSAYNTDTTCFVTLSAEL